eukprot:m.26649 g.26649  ORF g.26649 m.26649 type:complete len:1646 (-) comp8858_c0_seq2:1467-6404(-)
MREAKTLMGKRSLVSPWNDHSRIISVFFLANAQDFSYERQELHQRVVLRLKEHCRTFGFDLHFEDVRVGFEDDIVPGSTLSETTKTLFEHVATQSAATFVVVGLGQTLPPQMLPHRIPSAQYDKLASNCDDDDLMLTLRSFYKPDSSLNSEEYILQDTIKMFPDVFSTGGPQSKRRATARETYLRKKEALVRLFEGQPLLDDNWKLPYYTLLEDIKSLVTGYRMPRCVFTSRLFENADPDCEAFSTFISTNLEDVLEQTRQALDAKSMHSNTFQVGWHKGSGLSPKNADHANYLKNWASFVHDALSSMAEDVMNKTKEDTARIAQREMLHEQVGHSVFAAQLTDFFVGRDALIDQLMTQLTQTNDVAMLRGVEGIGKSSVCCRIVDQLTSKASTVVIYRACALTPMASTLTSLFMNVFAQLCAATGKTNTSPATLKQVVEQLVALSAHMTKVIVIIIDGVEKLADRGLKQSLAWALAQLQPHYRLLVSGTEEGLKFETSFPNAQFVLEPFSITEAMRFVAEYLSKHHKSLTQQQTTSVQNGLAKNKHPAYVSLLCQQAVGWSTSDSISTVASSTSILIKDLVDKLDDAVGKDVVTAVLGPVAWSEYGLSWQEIVDFLSLSEEVVDAWCIPKMLPPDMRRVSPFCLGRVLQEAPGLFVISWQQGIPVLHITSSNARSVLQQRYASEKADQLKLMIELFSGKWHTAKKKGRDGTMSYRRLHEETIRFSPRESYWNHRHLAMLPSLLRTANKMDQFESVVLMNFEFLEGLVSAFSPHYAIHSFSSICDASGTSGRDHAYQALLLSADVLTSNPAMLACELTGRLIKFSQSHAAIQTLLENIEVLAKQPETFKCLPQQQSHYFTPDEMMGSLSLLNMVTGMTLSANQLFLTSDQGLEVYSLEGGRLGPAKRIDSTEVKTMSSNQSFVAVSTLNGTKLLAGDTQTEISSMSESATAIFIESETKIALSHADGKVRVLENAVVQGEYSCDLLGTVDSIAMDEKLVVALSNDVLAIWQRDTADVQTITVDLEDAKLVDCKTLLGVSMSDSALLLQCAELTSNDEGTFALAMADTSVAIGSPSHEVSTWCVNPSTKMVACAVEGHVSLVQLQRNDSNELTLALVTSFSTPPSSISEVEFLCLDDKTVAASSDGGKVWVWELPSIKASAHNARISNCVLSSDGNLGATISYNGLRFWDVGTATWKESADVTGHLASSANPSNCLASNGDLAVAGLGSAWYMCKLDGTVQSKQQDLESPIVAVELAGDGVLSLHQDGQLKKWTSGAEPTVMHESAVDISLFQKMVVHANKVLLVNNDGTCSAFSSDSLEPSDSISVLGITDVVPVAETSSVLVAGESELALVDLRSGNIDQTFAGLDGAILHVSQHDASLAMACSATEAIVWDVQSGSRKLRVPCLGARACLVTATLALVISGKELQVYSLTTSKQECMLTTDWPITHCMMATSAKTSQQVTATLAIGSDLVQVSLPTPPKERAKQRGIALFGGVDPSQILLRKSMLKEAKSTPPPVKQLPQEKTEADLVGPEWLQTQLKHVESVREEDEDGDASASASVSEAAAAGEADGSQATLSESTASSKDGGESRASSVAGSRPQTASASDMPSEAIIEESSFSEADSSTGQQSPEAAPSQDKGGCCTLV